MTGTRSGRIVRDSRWRREGIHPAPVLICILIFAGVFNVDGRDAQSEGKLLRFQSTQMGMPFEILLWTPPTRETGTQAADNAAQAAFDEISRLNGIFSDYEYESEISRLNRTSGTGRAWKCSDELWGILQLSHSLYRQSDGLFDVAIGPATSLWRKARREKSLPSDRHLEMVRGRVGSTHLTFIPDSQSVRLEKKAMRLDLGGIAKGYALDAASRILHDAGFNAHLVRAGGDMKIGDAPPVRQQGDREGWKVTLFPQDDVPESEVETRHAWLSNCAVGTSGDIYQFVEIDGVRYSHIIHPKTSLGITGSVRAVVICEKAVMADSHSTIACLLPEATASKWLDQRVVKAHVMRHSGKSVSSFTTPGFWKFVSHSGHPAP